MLLFALSIGLTFSFIPEHSEAKKSATCTSEKKAECNKKGKECVEENGRAQCKKAKSNKQELKAAYRVARNAKKSAWSNYKSVKKSARTSYLGSKKAAHSVYISEKSAARAEYDSIKKDYMALKTAYNNCRKTKSSKECADEKSAYNSAQSKKNNSKSYYMKAKEKAQSNYNKAKSNAQNTYNKAKSDSRKAYDEAKQKYLEAEAAYSNAK